MIPYDELVSALARWRTQNGLGASQARSPGRASGAMAQAQPPRRSGAYAAAPVATAAAVDTGRTAQPAPLPAVIADEFEEGTEIHDAGTGEIDVDAEGVVVEEGE
jgi:hypothetical protein